MADCNTVFLSEIGDIVTGNTPKTSDEENYASNDIPFLKPSDFCNDSIDLENIEFFISEKARNKARILPVGSIAVTCIGIIGKTKVIHDECAFNQQINAIIPYDDNYNRYIAYAILFQKELLQLQANSAVVPIINKTDFSKISIPLPPLEIQRKIASNLDKVTHTIDLCNAILEKLDLLVKSRFVEMFGDPVANPYNFPIKTYGALFELNAGGTPSKAKKEYWENGTISWIGSNMCQDSIIYENDGKYITQEGYDNSSAKMFPIDTVLIALVGATIGKTALLKFETSTNQNVLGVRGITDAGYNPLFVYYYTQFLHSKFLNIGDGGFNMASKGFVSELPIYDIAIDYQNQFAIFAEQTDKSKSAVKQVLEKAETLKKALMQEYFG